MKRFVLASLTAITLAGLSNPAWAGTYNWTLSGLDTGSGILIAAAADNGGYDVTAFFGEIDGVPVTDLLGGAPGSGGGESSNNNFVFDNILYPNDPSQQLDPDGLLFSTADDSEVNLFSPAPDVYGYQATNSFNNTGPYDPNNIAGDSFDATPGDVPEPMSIAILGAGLIGLIASRRGLARNVRRNRDPRVTNPTRRRNGRYMFRRLRPGAGIRVVSRAGSPTEPRLARDPRTLGVAIRQIRLWQGPRLRVLNAADHTLQGGFHNYKADNSFRWTDGNAPLPATLFHGLHGGCDLELLVDSTVRYPLLAAAA
jgi:hypothetical protein